MTIQTTNGAGPAASTPALGESEHDKAMMAKADAAAGAEAEQPAAPVKPEGVPDKFWNAEKGEVDYAGWGKSTAELETKLSQGGAKAGADDAAKAAEDAAKAAGADTSAVDFASLSEEFQTTGQLSDESYAKLAKSGLDKDLVDGYLAGQAALAVQMEQEAYSMVGGETQYTAMMSWAMSNLSQAERDAYDSAVVGNSASRSQAITALQARFERAVGKNPALVQGSMGGSNAGYASRAEMVADMKDPRYQKDSAFRAKVQQKLAISDIF